MQKAIALALGVLLPLLGVAGVGQAQPAALQVEGIVQSVDCQTQTLLLSASGGSNTIAAAPYTAVLVNSTSVPFCSLEGYIGAPATAWLVADGDQFSATQIDITGPIVAAPQATVAVSPLPIVGTVLGTIAVAGLVYLLVHGPDGGYYRYPYYGAYYHYYYRPQYRPYTGFYPASAPIISVAPAISGVVLGVVVVNNLQYILARDGAGHLYRYPYYGPYHQYYYRSSYRPYAGNYQSTPVRQGDPHWDAPALAANHAPAGPNTSRPAPAPRQPVQPPNTRIQPQRQPVPIHQATPQRAPAQTPQQAPQRQAAPVRQATPQRAQVPIRPQQPQRQAAPDARPAPAQRPAPNNGIAQRPGGTDRPSPQPPASRYQSPPRPQPAPATPPQPSQTYRTATQGQPAPASHQAPSRQPGPASRTGRGGNSGGSRGSNQQCGNARSNQSCQAGGRPSR